MNKERLKEILLDQKDAFNRKKHLIDRDLELDKYISTGQVVILSGIRRAGKSSLLYLIKQKMMLDDGDYCYFNFDDERIIPETSIPDQVMNLHIEMHGKEPVLFFDEIQNVENWEKFVNRQHERGVKVFVTGSNARLLSSEISTSLTGRNKVVDLYPFSFAEFLRFRGKAFDLGRLASQQKALLSREFGDYVEIGGFPLVVRENDPDLINSYFQDILYRDIISRYKLSQVDEIKQIGLYFASNTGKLFSYSTLQEISGVRSTSSIKDYLSYYEQSWLFLYLKKFDWSVKKQIMNPKKVYAIDPAISKRLGFNFSQNRGRILENIIYIELRRRGKEVFYHAGKKECDFLVKEGLQVTEAIQVAWTVDEANYRRELEGLKEAMEIHRIDRGILITRDGEAHGDFEKEGITVLPAWKWLLS
jgi:predicted AAA+ superfamily ATPase